RPGRHAAGGHPRRLHRQARRWLRRSFGGPTVSRGAGLLYLSAALVLGSAFFAPAAGGPALAAPLLLEQAQSPDIEGLLAAALALGVAGWVIAAREGRVRPSLGSSASAASIEQLDPAASRELLLQVAAELKPAVETQSPDVVFLVDALLRAAI